MQIMPPDRVHIGDLVDQREQGLGEGGDAGIDQG